MLSLFSAVITASCFTNQKKPRNRLRGWDRGSLRALDSYTQAPRRRRHESRLDFFSWIAVPASVTSAGQCDHFQGRHQSSRYRLPDLSHPSHVRRRGRNHRSSHSQKHRPRDRRRIKPHRTRKNLLWRPDPPASTIGADKVNARKRERVTKLEVWWYRYPIGGCRRPERAEQTRLKTKGTTRGRQRTAEGMTS